jgi:Aspartyl protease/Tetratricopeptide repeat
MSSDDLHNPDRRTFLRRAGLAAGIGAALPLLGSTAGRAAAAWAGTQITTSPHDDPDQLLREGRFDEAERAFSRVLRQDPNDAHAAAQLGYIALLSNRFKDAETFLTWAITLAPDDSFSQMQLGDCFVRQDKLAQAVGPLRASGTEFGAARADQYAAVAVKGTPWQVYGAQSTSIPWLHIDPQPMVEARVNGLYPMPFLLDTGAGAPAFSVAVAQEASLEPVASVGTGVPGHTFTMYLGMLDSFQMGDIELRSIPCMWFDAPLPAPPGGPTPVGAFGTNTFYHFLTTMDFAGQALILRRKTSTQLRQFKTEAYRDHAEKLPLWIGGDHIPCTLGSLNGYGPKVVAIDTGGTGIGIYTSVEIAERVGIEVDYGHPFIWGGMSVYPIVPDEMALGRAVGRNVRGIAGARSFDVFGGFQFATLANFTHEFFKPFAITMDFTDMNLYITGESLTVSRRYG